MTVESHPYSGRIAGLATQHDKLLLVGPAMESVIGLEVVEVRVDTDTLGTFSGEVARPGSPWDTAVAKARLGMAVSGRPLGLASEGTFGPLGDHPFLLADTELVVLVDDERGIVIGDAHVEVGPPCIAVDCVPGALDASLLRRAGFPDHGLIVRPSGSWDMVHKGLHDLDALARAIAECAASSPLGTAHVTSDLRASHHPARRQVITAAAHRLAQRLAARCPTCSSPGWGVERVDPGAPCGLCGTPTRLAHVEHWTCPACDWTQARPAPGADAADPATCPGCNP